MNRTTAELEDQIRAVFAAQARGIDEQTERSRLDSGDSALWAAPPAIDSTEHVLLLDPIRAVRRPPPRRSALTVAAALVVAATGIAAVSRVGGHGPEATVPATGTSVSALVLAGETVLGTDPLVVQAPLGPDPTFDPSVLGTELRFEPVTSLDEAVVRARLDNLAAGIAALRSSDPEAAGLFVPKVTVTGWLDGKLWLTTVADRPAPPADSDADPSVTVHRYSWTSFEDGSTVLETPAPTVDGDSVEGIALPESAADPFAAGGGVAVASPTGPVFVNHLPRSVAVVSYGDADRRWWIRPRGGVAAFPADLLPGEHYTVRAYAADGTVLTEQGGDNTLASSPLEDPADPGELLLPVPTEDEHGQPVDLGGSGRPVILVYGGSWCAPCERGIADVTAVLDALGDTVDIYAVPSPSDAADAWPQLDAWHHPRIRFTDPGVQTPVEVGTASPLYVKGVPSVLVIGADGVVLARLGFENLADELAGLGLSPPPPGAD